MSTFPTEPPFAADIQAELDDPAFRTRKHGTRATGSYGCKGPLCRWVSTLRYRSRAQELADRANRSYFPDLKKQKNNHRAAEFDAAIAWHHSTHVTRRGGYRPPKDPLAGRKTA